MKKFGAKRVARKIGGDEEEPSAADEPQATENVVKRPPISKAKKSSSSRLSFGLTQSTTEEDVISTPKKSGLGRIAAERSASRLSSEHLPIRAGVDSERPSYSRDYLTELRKSQQSAPRPRNDAEDDSTKSLTSQTRELDIASKFGTLTTSSAIPSAAEIAEKKERRARLAKEGAAGVEEFISLDDTGGNVNITYSDDDEFKTRDTLVLPEKEKYAETRLIRDDEDIAEGFDEFVDDGKLELGRASMREAERRRRAEMQDMINAAEGNDDYSEDSDDSEADRNAAYEAAQTRRGGVRKRDQDNDRPRTPPKITPIPDLSTVIKKLSSAVEEAERRRLGKVKRLAEVRRERADINEREVWLQQQLRDAGEKFEKLKAETHAPIALPEGVLGEKPEEGDHSEESDSLDKSEEHGAGEQVDMRGVLLGNGLGGASGQESTMRAPSPDW